MPRDAFVSGCTTTHQVGSGAGDGVTPTSVAETYPRSPPYSYEADKESKKPRYIVFGCPPVPFNCREPGPQSAAEMKKMRYGCPPVPFKDRSREQRSEWNSLMDSLFPSGAAHTTASPQMESEKPKLWGCPPAPMCKNYRH
ncbi:uncharacterized protein LOC126278484 [Schistocerca gregaria]|uniref:uncharacterized protein LOC126278484 n=1 Tax=Schistocerca gregaria TaxID=7010 RepID=UPI00211DE882|nr:uncharacterized protein LOC126278484 [Schistocerca gregaria]